MNNKPEIKEIDIFILIIIDVVNNTIQSVIDCKYIISYFKNFVSIPKYINIGRDLIIVCSYVTVLTVNYLKLYISYRYRDRI